MQYGYEAVRSFKLPITVGKRQEHRKTYPPNMHFHNGYEVFLVTSGRYRIFAPQKLYEGEGACAMFVNRGVYHCTVRLDCETLPFCGYDLYFLQSVVDMMPPALLNMEPLLENNLVVVPLEAREVAYFEPKLAEMREIYVATRDSGKNPPVLYGLLLAVVNRLADLCGERGAQKFSAGSEGDLYITDVSKCIIEAVDAGRDIGVAELADRFYVSAGKLSYDFHRLTGVPLKRMICELRLQRAKDMLERGMEVKEVAQACGFTGDSYFVQFFKRYTSMSPGRYRDRRKE